MPDLLKIFETQPAEYDELVDREDHEGNLLPAVREECALTGRRIVEFGAGTGRLTRLMAAEASSIVGFDASAAMIETARRRMAGLRMENCRLSVADSRRVPAPTGAADLSIAGWSLCCLAVYTGERWRGELEKGLQEMRRVVREGGRVVIIETLGTGYAEPHPPDELLPYYDVLDQKGFRRKAIRTDYLFVDREQAERLTTFFFGEMPAGSFIETRRGIVLPECTGIWSIDAGALGSGGDADRTTRAVAGRPGEAQDE